MADDDEVFEVTAISEQLDLWREICTNKKCSKLDSRSKEGGNVHLMDYSCWLPVFLFWSRSIATIASFWQDNYENIFTHFGIY